MPPLAIAAGIAATGAIGGAIISSNAAKSASNTAAAAQRDAQAVQDRQFNAAQLEQARQFDASQAALRTGTENANAVQTAEHGANLDALQSGSAQALARQDASLADIRGTQADAFNDASGVQKTLYGNSLDTINRGYSEADKANQPFLTSGTSALNRLAEIYGLDTTDANGNRVAGTTGGKLDPNDTFYQSPDYQFRLSQGIKGTDAGAAARGSLDSGATRKAEIAYAGNLASGEFGNYAARLSALAGVGQTAAANKASGVTNYTNAITNLNNGYGNSYANLRTGTADKISSAIGDNANNTSNIYTGTADRIGNANTSYATQYGNAQLGQGTNLANAATSYGNNFATGATNYGNNYASSVRDAAANQANATLYQGANTSNAINGLAGTAAQYLSNNPNVFGGSPAVTSTGYAGPGLYQNGMFIG